jgi:hypothetical protein
MKTKLIILSALLFLLVGEIANAQAISQPAVLSSSGGRYVFGQISSVRADQYMLDTQTGRLWQIAVDTNNAPILQAVPYKSVSGNLNLVPQTPQEELQELQNAVNAEKNAQQNASNQTATPSK